MPNDLNAFTMREAQAADGQRLGRLAELDSSRVPGGRMLIAELDDELVAAVPIAGGAAIADPMRATSALVSLLGLRAAQLRGLEHRRTSRGRIRRLISGATVRRAAAAHAHHPLTTSHFASR